MSSEQIDKADWPASLEQLHECVVDQRFEEAVELCQQLSKNEAVPVEVQETLVKIHAQCELNQDHYEQVLRLYLTQDNKEDEFFKTLAAYAYYRLHKYEQAIKMASNPRGNTAQAHIVVQSQYRLHHVAGDAYNSILSSASHRNEEELYQILTNALAVQLSRATPYVETDLLNDDLLKQIQSTLDKDSAYDVWYNFATYQLLTFASDNQGQALLQQAKQACANTLQEEGASPKEIEQEVAAIQQHISLWSRQWRGLTAEDATDDTNPSVQVIAQLNRALAAHHLDDMPALDPTWTVLQQRLYHYNRAILQLRLKKNTDCLATCQFLLHAKTKKTFPYANEVDEAWWRARIAVVQAHAQPKDKAVKTLQDSLDSLQVQDKQPLHVAAALDQARAHVQLHLAQLQGRLETAKDKLKVLQELPASLQKRPAVVATLAVLHQALGHPQEATELLSREGGVALAEFYMGQGDYEKAVTVCQEAGDDVRRVQALSYLDPALATQAWKELNLEEEDDEMAALVEELDGEALEERDLPRRARKAMTRVTSSSQLADAAAGSDKKKSRDAILRRRARHKEAYLNNLISQGKYNPDRPAVPDPERWIPKNERSSNRRRRHQRGQNKGHQGGVSERDAAKLDVLARKTDPLEAGAPSTAHLGVVGHSKRGGRRR